MFNCNSCLSEHSPQWRQRTALDLYNIHSVAYIYIYMGVMIMSRVA